MAWSLYSVLFDYLKLLFLWILYIIMELVKISFGHIIQYIFKDNVYSIIIVHTVQFVTISCLLCCPFLYSYNLSILSALSIDELNSRMLCLLLFTHQFLLSLLACLLSFVPSFLSSFHPSIHLSIHPSISMVIYIRCYWA